MKIIKILRRFVLSVVFILRKIPYSSLHSIYRRPHRFPYESGLNSNWNQQSESRNLQRANAYCIIHLDIHYDEEKNSVRLKKWCLDIFYDTVTQYHFLWNSMFYIYLKRSWSNSLISVFYFSIIESTRTVPVFGPETLRTHFFESWKLV